VRLNKIFHDESSVQICFSCLEHAGELVGLEPENKKSTIHVLKCDPEPLAAVRDGSKPFEWRKEDNRKFAVGDLLILLKNGVEGGYDTGSVACRVVTYVLRGQYGVPDGYVVLGLAETRLK
jgi:hypothetical protein